MPSKGGSTRRSITPREIVAAILVVAGVWLVVANTRQVKVRLFIPQVTAPMWLILAATLVGGIVIGMVSRRRRT